MSSLSSRFPGTTARRPDLVVAEGPLLGVEPQPGLAVARVGAVALEALVRQDRPDLEVEVDLFVDRGSSPKRARRRSTKAAAAIGRDMPGASGERRRRNVRQRVPASISVICRMDGSRGSIA